MRTPARLGGILPPVGATRGRVRDRRAGIGASDARAVRAAAARRGRERLARESAAALAGS